MISIGAGIAIGSSSFAIALAIIQLTKRNGKSNGVVNEKLCQARLEGVHGMFNTVNDKIDLLIDNQKKQNGNEKLDKIINLLEK